MENQNDLTLLDKILYAICFVVAPLYILYHVCRYALQAYGV